MKKSQQDLRPELDVHYSLIPTEHRTGFLGDKTIQFQQFLFSANKKLFEKYMSNKFKCSCTPQTHHIHPELN